MHGRIKVRTTEEQKRAKELERENKLIAYKLATEAIFKIRGFIEKEEDILKLSGDVLSQNPDFHTLWNIRKEIFSRWKKEKIVTAKISEFFLKELAFVEQCLKSNPKSYGAWGHRCFILDNFEQPNWDREINLTSIFLEFDDRNFHCWDFRRYLSQAAKLSPQSELEFTTKKINADFSNFSSWHYRSCLLPLVHPGLQGKDSINEDILNSEFQLVQNAFFTDPNDQTAWFYHRYLLSKSIDRCLIDSIYIDRKRHCIIISFSRPVFAQSLINVFVNEAEINVIWNSENEIDYIAICDIDEELFENAELKFKIRTNENSSINLDKQKNKDTILKDKTYYDEINLIKPDSEMNENNNKHLEPSQIHNSDKVFNENVDNVEIDSNLDEDIQFSTGQLNNLNKRVYYSCHNMTYKDLGYTLEEINCSLNKQDRFVRSNQPTCRLSESNLNSLKHQISEIKQLFEIEPENKWVMHALLTLMFLVDSKNFHDDCICLVKKMKALDPMRTHYYQDYESKLKIHHQIESLSDASQTINLSALGLTCLFDFHRLTHLRSINLSDNQLLDVTACRYLRSVELLVLKGNKIRNIRGIAGLQLLNVLDLENNDIEFLEDLLDLSTCPQLHTIILTMNPITKQADIITKIKEKITKITNVEI